MTHEHNAHVTWSAEQMRRGLPAFTETIDPAWFEGAEPQAEEGWSLVCHFTIPPSVQGNPSQALVRFMVDHAPHDRLGRGCTLRLFERSTKEFAMVAIVD